MNTDDTTMNNSSSGADTVQGAGAFPLQPPSNRRFNGNFHAEPPDDIAAEFKKMRAMRRAKGLPE